MSDFTRTAVEDVKAIVEDPTLHLLKHAGGVAGGNKHLHNNIIYKFSNDSGVDSSKLSFASQEVLIACLYPFYAGMCVEPDALVLPLW